MITYSGRGVWPKGTNEVGVPTHYGPSLEDIAVGLGRQSRFAGQTREFYTVLCHSLVCGTVADECYPDNPMIARYLRLHDAHESMISDVPTTWKNPATRKDEAELDQRIFAEHLPHDLTEDELLLAKKIDAAALAAEAHVLGHAEAEKWWPREQWGDHEQMIARLTQMELTVGNPVRYLQPEHAIQALQRALA